MVSVFYKCRRCASVTQAQVSADEARLRRVNHGMWMTQAICVSCLRKGDCVGTFNRKLASVQPVPSSSAGNANTSGRRPEAGARTLEASSTATETTKEEASALKTQLSGATEDYVMHITHVTGPRADLATDRKVFTKGAPNQEIPACMRAGAIMRRNQRLADEGNEP